MRKWPFILIGFLLAGVSARWWVRPFLNFVGTNSNVIQGLSNLIQLIIWGGAGVSVLYGLRNRASANQPAAVLSTAAGVAVIETKQAAIVADTKPAVNAQINPTVDAAHAPENTYLHQLPPPLADFTDRQEEVAELQDRVQKDCRIFGFFGAGGIGKTDLAKKFVHEHLIDRYPDAQFFVKLGGTTKDPKSVSTAQAHIIASVGTKGKMGETNVVDPSAQYNNALYGKRAILFLDDAANNEQLQPLTPPDNCAMIVTSRQKLNLPGMHTMGVPPLKQKDACEFLLNLAPRIESHAAKIAELCGGLPIALRLIAGAIAERRDIPVEEFVEGLADRKERVALIQATLDLSYDLLSQELQLRFARLSVFPESFDANGAAAIWDLPLNATQKSLGDLQRFSLLEWYGPTGRYSLQPLVRDYADARLSDSEREVTEWKHGVYYLGILTEAGRQYLQGKEVSKQGLNLFDAERSNIHACQLWFQRNLSNKSIVAALTSNFSYSGSRLLALKQTPVERITWHQAILDAERSSTNNNEPLLKRPVVETGNLIFLAIAHRDQGDYDETISYCEKALSAGAELNDKRLESIARGYLGIAHYYKGNYEEATTAVQKAVEIAQQTKPVDKETEAELLRYLGHAHRGLGNYERAIQAYNQSLESARQSGGLSTENNALGALGRIYCDAGQQELARNEYLSKALELAIEIGDRNAESYALAHLGLANRDLGFYADALDYYKKALKLAGDLGHKQVETYSNGGIGKTYLTSNDLTNALHHTQLAVKLASDISMKRAQQFWETMLAQIHLYKGELDHALTVVEKARLYRSPWVDYRTNALYGLILAKSGRLEQAEASFKQAAQDAERVLTKTPSYFDAQYVLGIAFGGMALANISDRSSIADASCRAFEKAYAACKARGVINETLRLFEEFLSLDSGSELNRPRDLLKGLATAQPSSTSTSADGNEALHAPD